MTRLLATALLVITVPAVSFASEPNKPAKPEHVAEKSADSGEKMICKRFMETGSLVKGYRTCKTKRDWEREREALRSAANSGSCASQGLSGGC